MEKPRKEVCCCKCKQPCSDAFVFAINNVYCEDCYPKYRQQLLKERNKIKNNEQKKKN